MKVVKATDVSSRDVDWNAASKDIASVTEWRKLHFIKNRLVRTARTFTRWRRFARWPVVMVSERTVMIAAERQSVLRFWQFESCRTRVVRAATECDVAATAAGVSTSTDAHEPHSTNALSFCWLFYSHVSKKLMQLRVLSYLLSKSEGRQVGPRD